MYITTMRSTTLILLTYLLLLT